MIAYVGRGCYKGHIIPVFRRVAPFPRDFQFYIHSNLPTIAVQFTILSIIAEAYKLVDALIDATTALLNLFLCDNAIIDKTLFDGITTHPPAPEIALYSND